MRTDIIAGSANLINLEGPGQMDAEEMVSLNTEEDYLLLSEMCLGLL